MRDTMSMIGDAREKVSDTKCWVRPENTVCKKVWDTKGRIYDIYKKIRSVYAYDAAMNLKKDIFESNNPIAQLACRKIGMW